MVNYFNALRSLVFVLSLCLVSGTALAGDTSNAVNAAIEQFDRQGDFSSLSPYVVEAHTFYGLAFYYNSVSFYIVGEDGVSLLEAGQRIQLKPGEWFTAVGRFNVLVLQAPEVLLEIGDQTFNVVREASLALEARIVRKDNLKAVAPELDQLRYYHLWWPIAQLSRAVEWSLSGLNSLTGLGWGMAIVLFTIILKLLLVPLSLITVRMQRQVSEVQSKLAPVLAEIKAKYDGEEAHKRIMAAHRELNVSTFFVLKPMLGMLFQIPVWIAVFNALGEMPQLQDSSFLWIQSLAFPDSIATLPIVIPLFGDSVSLLPLLMTVVTIVSALLFQDRLAHASELKRQKRNLYLIALAFFVLFYPFPAAMVLYWTLSNALQIVQQRVIRI